MRAEPLVDWKLAKRKKQMGRTNIHSDIALEVGGLLWLWIFFYCCHCFLCVAETEAIILQNYRGQKAKKIAFQK